MKIGLFGNSVNVFYMIGKMLRKIHLDTQLVLDTLQTDPMHNPVWYDLDFELPYDMLNSRPSYEKFLDKQRQQAGWEMPDWVIGYEKAKLSTSIITALNHFEMMKHAMGSFFKCKNKGAILVLKEAIKNSTRLVGYDCVLATAMGPFNAYLANVPCIMWVTGGDVYELPFRTNDADSLFRARAKFQRTGLLHSKFILSYFYILEFLKRLNISDKYRFWCFPIDAETFKPLNVEADQLLDSKLIEKIRGRLLFYSPSRFQYGYKGNQKILHAFARFCRKYNAFLITHAWGEDWEKAKLLANQLGIEDSVYFHLAVLSKQRLAKFYNLADVIVDHFNIPAFGGVSTEAMSCGRPLLTYMDMKRLSDFIPEEPPIFAAHTEEEIYNKMVEATDTGRREELGKQARKWVTRYHGFDNINTLLNFMKESMKE